MYYSTITTKFTYIISSDLCLLFLIMGYIFPQNYILNCGLNYLLVAFLLDFPLFLIVLYFFHIYFIRRHSLIATNFLIIIFHFLLIYSLFYYFIQLMRILRIYHRQNYLNVNLNYYYYISCTGFQYFL